MAKVVAFCASRRNSGKTTLMLKLLECFQRRGVRTAVIKHGHHREADEGKDSSLYAAAGAQCAMFVSPEGWILESLPRQELPLDCALGLLCALSGCEVVLVEGYKHTPISKIAVCRSDVTMELPCPREELLAVVSDLPVETGLPCFDLNNDADAICDFILSGPDYEVPPFGLHRG